MYFTGYSNYLIFREIIYYFVYLFKQIKFLNLNFSFVLNLQNELLEEIKRLNAVIQQYEEKRSARSSHRSLSGSHRSVSSHTSLNNEKAQLNAIKTLQSVMKGHLERTRSLNASDHDHISVIKINSSHKF